MHLLCCSYSPHDANTDHTRASGDSSLPSQDVRSSEAEEHVKKGSMYSPTSPMLSTPSREWRHDFLQSVSGTSQQIFDLMKDRVKDRKAMEERHHSVQSPSRHQDTDYRHRQDVNRRLTPDVETVSGSGREWTGYDQGEHPSLSSIRGHRSQARNLDQDLRQRFSRNVAEHTTPDVSMEVHSKSVYDRPPLSGEPRLHHSYQSRAAAETGDLNSEALLSDEVQWLDSWTRGSEPGDVDLRNYRTHR